MLTCAGLAAAPVGCVVEPGRPRLWAASDMVHLTDRTPPADHTSVWEADTRTIRLFSSTNETVSFQLIVDAPPGGLAQVRLAMGELTGPQKQKLPADCVRLFRMLPVKIGSYPAWFLRLADGPIGPAGFYDALVPIDAPAAGQPLNLGGGERLAVWVDVSVPETALPGEYRGAISIRSAADRQQLTVGLKVYDLVLPNSRPVVCVGGFSHETIFRQFVRRPSGPDGEMKPFVPVRLATSSEPVRQGLVILRELMRLGHEHWVDLFDKTIHPLLKRQPSGEVALRWDDYDSIVKPYLDGTAFDDRIGVAAWPVPLWAGWPEPDSYGGAGTAAYQETLSAAMSQSVKHLETLGAKDRLFFWPRPEEAGPAGYQRHAALAGPFRAAAPEIPILSELPPTPPPETTWAAPEGFAKLADMYAPPADLVAFSQAGRLASRQHALAGLWLRPGRPPYVGSCGVLASPADVRALAWLAMKYGCAGILLPETLDWTGQVYRPEAETQGRLFYPGDSFGLKAVLPSVRLKWLRRGLQDVAYLWLLEQKQRAGIAQALLNTMVRYGSLDAVGDHYQDPRLDGWVRDGEVWLLARQLLADEALAAVYPGRASSHELLVQRLAWKKLTEHTGRVRAERVRSRVQPVGSGRFRAAIRVELYNEFTRPVDVAVKLTPPPGWGAAQPEKSLPSLGGGKRAVIELVTEGDHLPIDIDGKMRMPLGLTTSLGQQDALSADVPVVLAGWCGVKLTIDGDLHDWPLRVCNRAGAFKLLGRRGRVGDGLARRQTAVFALHDAENLYLAFRCEEPIPASIRAEPNNIIRYDQLMASGEDLVEVIIDPTGQAESVEELYHLIVKCNGVMLAERGAHTDPPLGRWQPWPVGAKVAIGKGQHLWIVELAVPLRAFQAASPEGSWRVNFTRFATTGGEASSWSGAPRYFYHPENLGTMVLVPRDGQVRLRTTQPAGQ